MAIVKAPLASDPKGKCSRWRVILYNKDTHRQEWHTVSGGKADAQAFERQQKERLRAGTYIAKPTRKLVREVVASFLREREARGRRTATLIGYKADFGVGHPKPEASRHLLAKFGEREIGSLRRADFAAWFEEQLTGGSSSSRVNHLLRTCKALLFYAVESELVERNALQRFRPYADNGIGRKVARDAFTEAEVRSILEAAKPSERAFIGFQVLTGTRPGEAYALRVQDLDLKAGTATIARNYDHRGKKFVEPKTRAGKRTVPLSPWLVDELRTHLDTTKAKGEALVFTSAEGSVLEPAGVRRRLWLPLVARAGVRKLDLYSLRASFATFARAAGQGAFNVARAMGHARSTLVDDVYARGNAQGLESVATAVTDRVMGKVAAPTPTPPKAPTAGRRRTPKPTPKAAGRPALRLVKGGFSPDVREPLDGTRDGLEGKRASR